MPNVGDTSLPEAKFKGLKIGLFGLGKTELTERLSQNSETAVYVASHPGLAVKMFDLECGKADEVSYGPYLSYGLEVENFEDIQRIEELRIRIPAYYGSNLDMEGKYAFIAMEYLNGQNLLSWCEMAARAGYPGQWADEFRATVYETLAVVRLFHEHGIILIDFKPDNVIRLSSGGIKFVDLGAFLTPRHSGHTDKYVYSATPDYAELVIDTSNVQTGIPLTQGSDIFAAGVALFEMASGSSRLVMAEESALKMLARPAVYRFRDSQIRDVWRAYPHLEDLLTPVETQLKERRILFSEFWHVLKAYLAGEAPDWETLSETQHRQMLVDTGTAFIADQLPPPLKWLASPIAQATTLRGLRLPSVAALMDLIAVPVAEPVRDDLVRHNSLPQFARDLDPPIELRQPFNVWEVRSNPQTGHWAIAARLAADQLPAVAAFTFLHEINRDEIGHRFFQIVSDLEADDVEGGKLTLAHLANDHAAWLGA